MKKILLIEDHQELRENTAEILTLANYEVVEAENGRIGVEKAKAEKPDLIICDIMMPQLDGYGVLHMLSKNPDTSGIPFIFLTAKSEKEDFRKGMNLGADDYLVKPFDDIELLDAIEMRLKKNEILKADFQKSADGLDDFMQEAKGMENLDKLTSGAQKKTIIKKKQYLFSQMSYPHALYFLNKGSIKGYQTNHEGREYITNLYKAGDFIGHIDLLKEQQYRESAVTMEDSEVTVIPRDDFFSLLYKNRDVASKFIKILSNNLAEKEERLLKLAYNSVRRRVSEALLLLEKQYKKENENVYVLNISREDLANLVGASTETVIRTLSDFKDEKLIDISGGKISIVNSEKLSRIKG